MATDLARGHLVSNKRFSERLVSEIFKSVRKYMAKEQNFQ